MQDQGHEELSLKVSREVILDLLPLYLAGEASAETCALVEEYLKHDAELLSQIDRDGVRKLIAVPLSGAGLPAELELRSLRRTRGLLRWQRRIYGWALALSIASLGGVGFIQQGHFAFHFFFRDYPQVFVPCISLAVSLWINYFVLRWRLRSTKL
ncbi:MAG: hypothetical protein ACLP7O_16780 [Terracidiphilus sp.]